MPAALAGRPRESARPWPRGPLEAAGDMLAGKFMGVDVPLERARFAVLPLPYERTTSYKKGTGRGPAAFLEGSLGVELFDEELAAQTYRAGIHTAEPLAPDEGETTDAYFGRVAAAAQRLGRLRGKTPFFVGGEHSLSQATIPALARLHPRLSVLHFDAHADLRPEYEGDPHNHASALYPASRLVPVVQVGIRSIGEEEAHLVNAGKVRTHLMHETRGVAKLAGALCRELTDDVLISIDLDGFDPSVIPGVGTPQPGGFSWSEGLELFRRVIERKNVVAVDVMELCPLKDTVQSELAAAKLAYRLMGYLARRDGSR